MHRIPTNRTIQVKEQAHQMQKGQGHRKAQEQVIQTVQELVTRSHLVQAQELEPQKGLYSALERANRNLRTLLH